MAVTVMALSSAVLVAGLLAACSAGLGDPASPTGPSAPSTSSSSSGSSGTTTEQNPTSSTGVPASCNGDEGGIVPTNAKDLNAWLQKRAYKCWAHESAPHDSAGPHGGMVQTYLNATLE